MSGRIEITHFQGSVQELQPLYAEATPLGGGSVRQYQDREIGSMPEFESKKKRDERARFFALAQQLSKRREHLDPCKQEKLKQELARMTFGERGVTSR
jgi:hypothetical protein